MNDHAAQPDAALADVGLIGLAVMGQNLVLNMAENGHSVKVYNRTLATAEQFVAEAPDNFDITMGASLREFVAGIRRPRRILLLVRAGAAVDSLIDSLGELLEPGDLVVDTGNSDYRDYGRRAGNLEAHGVHYVGAGVSGGEEGARFGPSIMPGGASEAWSMIEPLFASIAAKAPDGAPCTAWMGPGGSGHYVKMVHNGIEYGDMQLIAESYDFMGQLLGMDNAAMAETFREWDQGELDSYLIEITAEILAFEDEDGAVIDRILDKAGQKGTGKWTGINALQLGVPLTLIGEAVFARALSAMKDERVRAEGVLHGPTTSPLEAGGTWIEALGEALFAAKIVSYAQGYMLMREAAAEYDWSLNYGGIAQMWRGGCIIRSAFLDRIKAAFDKDPELPNLLLDDWFAQRVQAAQDGWRRTLAAGLTHGLPMPATSAALAFYDGYRRARLPANMIQAQRDYFGAHTWQHIDGSPEHHHTDWIGSGGKVSSTAYDA